MTFEIGVVGAVLILIFAALIFNLAGTEVILFAGVSIFVLTGILSPEEAFQGFSNPGLITVGLLFVVSAAVKTAGNLDFWMTRFLGIARRTRLKFPLFRMMAPVTFFSAFINNTPIVVIFTPVIKKWAERLRLSPSKFLIPLSYAAILGGMCTLIGTSTNLLAHGLMISAGFPGMSLFELSAVGIPCAIAGILYMVFAGVHLLPDRKDVQRHVETTPREYVIEMKVLANSSLAGKTIRDAGLRNLRGLYLLDIERGGNSVGPVSSKEVLQPGDHLVFVGVPSSVVDLQEIQGLAPAAHDMFERDFKHMRTHFVEAVISSGSPVLGKTVKECDFRRRYGAGVVAIHRNGERIQEKIGSIRLKAGDTLLLYAEENFAESWRDSGDFYLISELKDRPPELPHKSALTLAITALMVLAAAFGEMLPAVGLPAINVLYAVLGAVALLVLTRCIDIREAKRAIQWDVLLVIGFAIGLSRALQLSGAADLMAAWMKGAGVHFGPLGMLVAVYAGTLILTELLSNNAAVALSFPLAAAAAAQMGMDARPFFIAVTIAASSGFACPIGYQTHLIVQGPGGYKFSDFFRVGLPLDLIVAVTALSIIPFFWPF